MKKFFAGIVCCLFTLHLQAQTNTDSLAYDQQRKKINSMLAQREAKFDRYDESLEQRTGIFGLQTKKDIRRSNEILMDITGTDNEIFKQLKILLDYRAFEQKQVKDQVVQVQTSNMAYMNTINNLRQQNERLTAEADKLRQEHEKSKNVYLIIIIGLIITSILLLLTRKRRFKA